MKKSCSVSLLENTMSRVYCSQLRNRIMLPEDASNYIKSGMTVAFGGISSAGYPKAIPQELRKRQAAGEDLNLFMVSGTAIHQIDEWLSESVTRRTPMFESKAMRNRVNSGKIHYVEQQIGKSIRLLHTGAYGKIDVAVVEALLITEDCALVPTSSVCYLPHFLELADKVIIEVNSHLPLGLEGYHDIYVPGLYPNRAPIPLHNIRQRYGQFVRLGVTEGKRQRSLCVRVDQQYPFVFQRQPDTEICGRRGLAHAYLLVRHCDNFAIRHLGFPPLHRFSRLRR